MSPARFQTLPYAGLRAEQARLLHRKHELQCVHSRTPLQQAPIAKGCVVKVVRLRGAAIASRT